MTTSRFVRHSLKFVFGVQAIALAIGFGKYVGVGYFYFPPFPNYLDVALGVAIGVYLVLEWVVSYLKPLLRRR